jgi:Uma2 family endonuclease
MTAKARALPPLMTVDEFLDWPGDGARYELVDGVLRAMDSPGDTHGTIDANLVYLLTAHLVSMLPHCRVVSGIGVQPRVRADWNFRVPDLAVTCEPNEKGARSVPEPFLIVEFLSPSNAADTWDNVRTYTTLPSVTEIVVIYTTRQRADVFTRDEKGHWPANGLEITTGDVAFHSLDLTVPLPRFYRNTWLAT